MVSIAGVLPPLFNIMFMVPGRRRLKPAEVPATPLPPTTRLLLRLRGRSVKYFHGNAAKEKSEAAAIVLLAMS